MLCRLSVTVPRILRDALGAYREEAVEWGRHDRVAVGEPELRERLGRCHDALHSGLDVLRSVPDVPDVLRSVPDVLDVLHSGLDALDSVPDVPDVLRSVPDVPDVPDVHDDHLFYPVRRDNLDGLDGLDVLRHGDRYILEEELAEPLKVGGPRKQDRKPI